MRPAAGRRSHLCDRLSVRRSNARSGRRSQRGSATLLAVTMVGVLGVTALLVALLGGVLADQRRVEAAADLAALAAAGALQEGADGCAAAVANARRNHASVETCSTDGEIVTVTVGLRTHLVAGRRLALHARARAGPVGLQDTAALQQGGGCLREGPLQEAGGRLRGGPLQEAGGLQRSGAVQREGGGGAS